jgi:teichuronic acid biosynthesis glycosyltransferase TuaC
MRQRVLIVSSWYPSAGDRVAGTFVRDQAVALAREHDVAVIAPVLEPRWRGISSSALFAMAPADGDPFPVLRPVARFLVPRRIDWRPAANAYLAAVVRATRVLFRDWGAPTVIHAHVVLPAGCAAARMGRQLAVPVVLTEHSHSFAMHLGSATSRSLVREALRAATVIAVSPALSREITSFEPTVPVRVVGNVVDVDRFADVPPAVLAGRARFLALGIAPQKGIDDLLDALRLLLDRGVDAFEVSIGGDGPTRRQLERRTIELGLLDHCRFLGALSRSEVRDWMEWADVFVSASHYESFGVVVAEALASGRRVIATRSGGVEYVLPPEFGIFVDPNATRELADAMIEIVRPDRAFDAPGARASVRARFGPDTIVRQLTEIYESTARGH